MKRRSSTKPRGATSYKETAFGIIPRSKLLHLEIEGTKRGLGFIRQLILKHPEMKITPDLILSIHRESFGWIFPDWAGEYRNIRVEFSGKEAALPYRIPEMMINLCGDLSERIKYLDPLAEGFIEEIVELSAWFQHRFVLIHPFQDYNGRTARMITTLILLTFNLPPIEIKAESGLDRKNYLKAMHEADEGNYKKLKTLIEKALKESFTKITK